MRSPPRHNDFRSYSIPPRMKMGAVLNRDPHITRLTGFYGVSDSPSSTLFPTFKRQFHASISISPGYIDIQSKTKAREFARIKISSLKEKPFIRPLNQSIVVLRNSGGAENWYEVAIKATSPSMATELCKVLTEKAWATVPTTRVLPPVATVIPAASTSSAVNSPNMITKNRLPLALVSPSSVSRSDDDIQVIGDDNLKIRVRVNKDHPSSSAVIPSPINHRPKIMVKRENDVVNKDLPLTPPARTRHQPPTSTGNNANSLLSPAPTAARVLQFGETHESQSDTQTQPMHSPSSSPFHMQQLLSGEKTQQAQMTQSMMGQLNGTSNQLENMDTASSSNQTPAPQLQPQPPFQLNLRNLLTPNPTPPLPQPTQQQSQSSLLQNSLAGGLLGGLINPSTGGNYFGMNLGGRGGGVGGYSGGSSFVGSSPMLQMDDDEMREYRTFAAEFEQLAARVALLPSEKRRHMIKVAQSLTDMVCSQEM